VRWLALLLFVLVSLGSLCAFKHNMLTCVLKRGLFFVWGPCPLLTLTVLVI
jgi:hypothetical protein